MCSISGLICCKFRLVPLIQTFAVCKVEKTSSTKDGLSVLTTTFHLIGNEVFWWPGFLFILHAQSSISTDLLLTFFKLISTSFEKWKIKDALQ